MEFWNQKTFCLVTGASRGIGRTIAIEFSKKVAKGSVFLLIARSKDALENTKQSILEASGDNCKVVVAVLDLGQPDPEVYLNMLTGALAEAGSQGEDFSHAIIVHNAGSLGLRSQLKVAEMEDLAEIRGYFDFNLFSMIVLNTQFFKVFNDSSKQRTAIQISSLGAVQPFNTWGLYCLGKAARDMALKSIASESGIQTLNYAPGPVQTEIYDEATKYTGDPEVAAAFANNKKDGNVLTCEQTIAKLVRVLTDKKFIKGEHVDYYDIE